MPRKTLSVSIGPSKPRNHVVLALIRKVINHSLGRHQTAQRKRSQARDPLNLDQRVRESGEW